MCRGELRQCIATHSCIEDAARATPAADHPLVPNIAQLEEERSSSLRLQRRALPLPLASLRPLELLQRVKWAWQMKFQEKGKKREEIEKSSRNPPNRKEFQCQI